MNIPGINDLRFLDFIQGFEKVVIVNALEIELEDPACYTIRVLIDSELLDDSIFYSTHDTSLGMALKLAKESISKVISKKLVFIKPIQLLSRLA